jgi:hypothetical protein
LKKLHKALVYAKAAHKTLIINILRVPFFAQKSFWQLFSSYVYVEKIYIKHFFNKIARVKLQIHIDKRYIDQKL